MADIKTKSVSIITLTHNQLENATKPFIKSLYEHTDSCEFELIIVDNGSTDGTVEFLENIKNSFANIKIIFNQENTGYSCGNNIGLKATQGDYIILANNDVLFTKNWLNNLLIPFKNSKIGCVGPMTNYCGHSDQLLNVDVNMSNYEEKFKEYILNKKGNPYIYTNRVIFFCIALTRSVFEKIGYLDELFSPAWFEDDDYCARIIKLGYKIAIARNVFIYHNHSQTTSKISNKEVMRELFERNRKIFEEKHKDYLMLDSIRRIPIFIISFNRLECLKKLINWLEYTNLENIIILDNNSTYPPLVKYLNSLPYQVVFLEKNFGFTALWDTHLYDHIILNQYFVLTDPDILPIEECPSNVLFHFMNVLESYPHVDKVGFSLKTDDLPESYSNKKLALKWKKQYKNKISKNPILFDAPIKTTFALYRPNRIISDNPIGRGIRTGFPFVARHLTWYTINETAEDEYYRRHQNGSWIDPEWYQIALKRLQKKKRSDFLMKISLFFRINKLLHLIKIIFNIFPSTFKVLLNKSKGS